MKVFCKEFITVWTRGLVRWLSRKFDSISIDLTPVEDKLDEVKGDVADVKTAVEHIDFSTLAKQGTDQTATLTAIKELLAGGGETPEELPEGLADRVMLLLQHFGIAGSYEAEAKGGERTNNTVIDECKVRFQDAFNGLLPTGFTMPNSVTVDNLTYTGTTNS